MKASFLPSSTWCTRTVQGSKVGIDSTNVCFWTQLVVDRAGWGWFCAVIDRAIFPGVNVSHAFAFSLNCYTYSLGFFLGPGLPRSLFGLSGGGVDHFSPFTAERFLLMVPPSDGRSWTRAGVDAASEMFSCDTSCFNFGISSVVGTGEDAIEEGDLFDRNLFNVDGGNANTMIFVCFINSLSALPFVRGVVDMVIVVVDIDAAFVESLRQ